ncbi:hypothetical protein QM351_07760 [Streptococcus parasanguinis]|uniref:hypothetical protein n=1 Tax=Streptococcus parasanguinis TaxID=1318 RepID=UPI0039C20F5B
MAIDIKLVLSDQEQLIFHSMNLATLTAQVTAKVQDVVSKLPNLSSQGAFHDLIVASDSNGGLGLFYLKAQEFQTISEVLYRHAQNTYDKMVDTDKILATAIANLILDDSNTSEDIKEAIKKDPKGSVDILKQNLQEEAKKSKEEGGQ